MVPLGAGAYAAHGWWLVIVLSALSFLLGVLTVAWLAWDEGQAMKSGLDPSKRGSSGSAEPLTAEPSPNPKPEGSP
jgi:hypothetical protein